MVDADLLSLVQTILTGISLLAIIFAVVALCTERIRRVRANDERYQTTNAALMGCLGNKPVSAISSLLGAKSPVLALPSIEGLIEAADRGLWTSTTLDHMAEVHPELTWLPVYESTIDDIQLHQNELPRAWGAKEPIMTIFQNMMRPEHVKAHRPTELVGRHRSLFSRKKLACCIRELPVADEQLQNQGVTKREDGEKGLGRVKPTWIVQGKPCIPVTREELVALCLVMGMSIVKSNNGLYFSGIGAYGLSVDLTHTESTWRLSIGKGSRISRHAPSMGSGYTSLMAKHLACGSIPFSESTDWVRSVYVTDAVLAGIKHGVGVMDTHAYGGKSLEFLRRLPADKAIDAYYGLTDDCDDRQRGSLLNADFHEVGRWARTVAGIAFGGLVPQAAPNVIEAVRFTVAGKIDDCVQNVETLIDELHRADRNASMFGQRVAERTAATGHTYVNHTHLASDRNPRDAASTFSRYMNLLERVVALCESLPETKPGVPAANGGRHGNLRSTRVKTKKAMDVVFDATADLLERVYTAAVKAEKTRTAPQEGRHPVPVTAEEQGLLNQDLGAALHAIEERLAQDMPITLKNASVIVRCILAAWADTVPTLMTKEHLTHPGANYSIETGVEVLFMNELPSIMALG